MIREFAPAKINLTLHVLGKRVDGYHTLESLITFADIGDVLTVNAQEGDITLTLEGEFAHALGKAEDNLVLRAAREVKKQFGIAQGAAITLTKNLPVASGIGGGSADAAATLRALRKAWDLPRDARFVDIAIRLGSDVSVCLKPQTVIMSGRGETFRPAETMDVFLLLVNPNMPLSTADVFKEYAKSPAQGNASSLWLAGTRNDLEPAAIALMPVIKDILATITAQPGCTLARMSGSGATCFGVFAKRAEAEHAAKQIASKQPSWWIKAAGLYHE